MDEKHRLEGFRALLASHKSGYLLEEPDGERKEWSELSAEGRLDYIAGDAALYDLPFAAFAEAARAELGDAAAVTQAALRLALDYRKELHGLAKLVPDNGRTESTPLIEQFQEMLAYPPAQRAGLMAYETAEGLKTELEAFGDEFERLARTPEQKKLAAGFQEFVGEVTRTGMRETFDTLLRRFEAGDVPQTGGPMEIPAYTPTLLERLCEVEHHAMEGMDSVEPAHMEASLQDVLRSVRAAITEVSAGQPAKGPEAVLTRLEVFAKDFEGLAETEVQRMQADQFRRAVEDMAEGKLLAAADFPGWLKGHADRFAEMAVTPAEKSLATAFHTFAREVGGPQPSIAGQDQEAHLLKPGDPKSNGFKEMLDRYAQRQAEAPQKGKDQDLDR